MPRSTSVVLPLVVAAMLGASPGAGGDRWVRVCSPHLEVLSDAGEAPAREAARRLERLRGVLLRLFPNRHPFHRPITLLVVGSGERFSSLVPREGRRPGDLGGFFQGGSERDYAVLHLSPGQLHPFEAAEHEIAHLVLNGSLVAQPPWVAEGLAEVLSGGRLDDGEARLGAARPAYEAALRRRPGSPLEALLAIGYDSPEYRGEGQGGVLYARSWALTRWVLRRRGLPGLRSYLEAVAEGTESTTAFATRLGDLAEAEVTLLDVPPGPLFRLPLEGSPDPLLEVDVPGPADVEQRLGDLLLQGGHREAARRRFARALEADPDHSPTRSSLADLLVRQGQWEAAREQLEAVLRLEPDDPVALVRLARLRLGEARARGTALPPEAEDHVVDALERALARAPHLHEGALLLAQLRPQPYRQRLALLRPLFDQQPDRTAIGQTLSRLHLELGELAEARRILERAREGVRDPALRYLVSRQLARLEGFGDATAVVRGDLVHLDCRADGSLRFTISADPKTVRLEAASTESFLVHGDDGTVLGTELLCGEQDVPLVVRYAPGASVDPDVSGSVVWLAFAPPARE